MKRTQKDVEKSLAAIVKFCATKKGRTTQEINVKFNFSRGRWSVAKLAGEGKLVAGEQVKSKTFGPPATLWRSA
jgi:hypothetical protein